MKLEFLERGKLYRLPSRRLAQFIGRDELLLYPSALDDIADPEEKLERTYGGVKEKVVVFRYVDEMSRLLTKEEVHFSLAGFKKLEHCVGNGYRYD